MDKNKMQQQEAARYARPIIASRGPKCLSFQIGRRGRGTTTLLITNCFGVYSLRRRRYVRKTRFRRFHLIKTKAGFVAKQYASLKKAGMLSWPEFDEGVTLCRGRLADMYWGGAPAWYRERVTGYFLAARAGRLLRFCAGMAMIAAWGLFAAKMAWSAVMPARTMFLYVVFCVCVFCRLGAGLWRETFFDEPDPIVRMLEIF